MNRTALSAVFIFLVGLLSVCVLSAPTRAEVQGFLIEKPAFGEIDWTRGIVRARGKMMPSDKWHDNAGDAEKTHSAAVALARYNMAVLLRGIRIHPAYTVGQLAQRYPEINDMLDTMVAGLPLFAQQYLSDGTVEVTLEMSLYGAFAQLVFPADIKHIETIKPLGTPSPSNENVPLASDPAAGIANGFTGLVVDARGLGLQPILCPRIIDESGQEAYGSAYVSREFAIQSGMAVYMTETIDTGDNSSRVGDNPLTVKALRREEEARGHLVISNAAAARLRSTAAHLAFLRRCRVIILTDPVTDEG